MTDIYVYVHISIRMQKRLATEVVMYKDNMEF